MYSLTINLIKNILKSFWMNISDRISEGLKITFYLKKLDFESSEVESKMSWFKALCDPYLAGSHNLTVCLVKA